MKVMIKSLKSTATRELALFLGLLFAGLVILPVTIFMVGKFVFGEYGGTGLPGFYGTLQSELRDGNPVVLFLVLSPYLIWQLTRLTAWGFRQTRQRRGQLRG